MHRLLQQPTNHNRLKARFVVLPALLRVAAPARVAALARAVALVPKVERPHVLRPLVFVLLM